MDYELYDQSGLLLNGTSPDSKNSWNIPSDHSMDNNDEYFDWNPLKIDEEMHHPDNDIKVAKKRKIPAENEEQSKLKQPGFKIVHVDSLDIKNQDQKKISQNNTARMPSWQVEDITELNGDIDSSLSLGSDLANNPYNVNDTILTISGLTVFKQEAPSPTSNEAAGLPILRQQQHRQQDQSPTSSTQIQNGQVDETAANQNVFNNTINQLLGSSGYTLQNAIDANLVPSSTSQDNYNVSSTNPFNFTEDYRFQYVLAAATSIATKVNEDTLTYLNQGQSYEIKLKKLGDLSLYRGKLLKSVIRICFHERRLQYMEKEQMASWQKARPGDRIMEVDVPLSYGASDIVQPPNALNVVHFNWDPTKEVGVYIKVNCISTEFTPRKHGGEKGVPFRIQVETYPNGENFDSSVRLHAAACQVKVFKLKGADRKHKQDREKIMKRPVSEQEKYQPSYECTVLNDVVPSEAVVNSTPILPLSSSPIPESGTDVALAFNNSSSSNVFLEAAVSPINPPTIKPIDNLTPVVVPPPVLEDATVEEFSNDSQLHSHNAPEHTAAWLVKNRFSKYLDTFASFSGSDMLRMSREDLMQICGQADGIRLYNALHSKTIAPKLKLYVCRENSLVFTAIFLTSFSADELTAKLTDLVGIAGDKIQEVHVQGPQNIRVQLTNDVLRHFKEEATFSCEILQEGKGFVLLLKYSHK